MIFKRRYVLIGMGINQILAFFNEKRDAEEYLEKLTSEYPTKYQSIKIFVESV